jgi:hypothetical protein
LLRGLSGGLGGLRVDDLGDDLLLLVV